MRIKLISCGSGDWEVLMVDNEVFHEGHRIPTHIWMDLLSELGNTAIQQEISDEDMENQVY